MRVFRRMPNASTNSTNLRRLKAGTGPGKELLDTGKELLDTEGKGNAEHPVEDERIPATAGGQAVTRTAKRLQMIACLAGMAMVMSSL